jgi:hypothetical protein
MLHLAYSTKLSFLPTVSLTTYYICAFLHRFYTVLLKILANIHDRNVEIISVFFWYLLRQRAFLNFEGMQDIAVDMKYRSNFNTAYPNKTP